MPNTSLKINPTRLDDQLVKPKTEAINRLVDDPEFAPEALASEEDAVRGYARSNRTTPQLTTPPPAPAGSFDVRLRPWGSAVIAVWAGTLIGAALARQYRRRK